MTKNERVEVLMKELSEIGSILNAIKECTEPPKSLINMAAEKSYYFGRSILLLSDEFDDVKSTTTTSAENENVVPDDYFIESEVENIFLQPERCVSTRISTNPSDMTPWMPDSVAFEEKKDNNTASGAPKEVLEVDTSDPQYVEVAKNEQEAKSPECLEKKFIHDNKMNESLLPSDKSISKHLETDALLGDLELQKIKEKDSYKEEPKIQLQTITMEQVKEPINAGDISKPTIQQENDKIEKSTTTIEKGPEIKQDNNLKQEKPAQKQAFESLFKTHPQAAKVTPSSKSDIRRLLSLNDRFLFQRELFRGDVGLMNYTFDEINNFNTFEEALEYIQANFKWDSELQEVRDFMNLIERHFSGKIL